MARGCKSGGILLRGRETAMEEVEDKFWEEERCRPKSVKLLMYQIDDSEAAEMDVPRTKHPTQNDESHGKLNAMNMPSKPKVYASNN